MKNYNFLLTVDPFEWADSFLDAHKTLPDRDTLAAWFANAFCAGKDDTIGDNTMRVRKFMSDDIKPATGEDQLGLRVSSNNGTSWDIGAADYVYGDEVGQNDK